MDSLRRDLPDREYIEVLETKNARLDKLLTISEAQKDHLRGRNKELQEKIAEIIKNSGESA
jgi:hypothetical protein